MPRELKEKSVKSVAGTAFSAFTTKKVSTDAKANANASRGATPISGGNVGPQESSDIFEPLEDQPAGSQTVRWRENLLR